DQAVAEDVPRLADAVRAIDRLRLDRRVPPRIEQEHRIGGGEIQPDAARLQADQEQRTRRIVLEAIDAGVAVAGAAVAVLVRDLPGVELAADDGEELGELREDERLVPFLDRLAQARQQRVQLRRVRVEAPGVDQAGVAGGLAQAEQRLEHLDLLALER